MRIIIARAKAYCVLFEARTNLDTRHHESYATRCTSCRRSSPEPGPPIIGKGRAQNQLGGAVLVFLQGLSGLTVCDSGRRRVPLSGRESKGSRSRKSEERRRRSPSLASSLPSLSATPYWIRMPPSRVSREGEDSGGVRCVYSRYACVRRGFWECINL